MADLQRFDLTGRAALITGAAQGIGFTLAHGLAQAGASVAVNDCDEGRLRVAVARLLDLGVQAAQFAFDVTIPDQVEAGVTAAEEQFGPIEILVNNAAVQHRESLENVPPETWRRIIDVNLNGVFLVSRAVARRMIERGHGKIINIVSVNGEGARPGIAPYASTKGAVKMLTKGMCADWARYGLQVNAIGPGYFATPLTQPLRDDPAFDAWITTRVPAGRWGDPEELVGSLVFLASSASDFVNGHTLYVDGGLLAVI